MVAFVWRIVDRADGLALVATDGPRAGLLRIRERTRPLRSASAIIAELARRAGPVRTEMGPLEALVTVEGEHAAFRVLRGDLTDGPYTRAIGILFGDDDYTLIDAASADPAYFDELVRATRDLTLHYSLGLGHRRARRFRYTPPADWIAVPRGLDACWLAPDAPARDASILVRAALPAGVSRASVLAGVVAHERLLGAELPAPGRGTTVFARDGLAGTVWTLEGTRGGRPWCCDVAVFEDERFLYPLVARREPGDTAAAAAFTALVASAQAVPLPQPRTAADAMQHWAT